MTKLVWVMIIRVCEGFTPSSLGWRDGPLHSQPLPIIDISYRKFPSFITSFHLFSVRVVLLWHIHLINNFIPSNSHNIVTLLVRIETCLFSSLERVWCARLPGPHVTASPTLTADLVRRGVERARAPPWIFFSVIRKWNF